jgi:hypothetical protein
LVQTGLAHAFVMMHSPINYCCLFDAYLMLMCAVIVPLINNTFPQFMNFLKLI